uniref:CCHC-type domain-containing protein n=1 Tax=Fagus sylvatica TaxID=28930 RepID=A0A2N9H897_FAGSY
MSHRSDSSPKGMANNSSFVLQAMQQQFERLNFVLGEVRDRMDHQEAAIRNLQCGRDRRRREPRVENEYENEVGSGRHRRVRRERGLEGNLGGLDGVDHLGSIKMKIPSFQVTNRRRNYERPVETWGELKALMRPTVRPGVPHSLVPPSLRASASASQSERVADLERELEETRAELASLRLVKASEREESATCVESVSLKSQGSTYRFNNLRVKIMANTPRPQMLEAMSTLYCALDPIEYNRVSGCDSAKEIWDKLEVTYEGTNQVKESKMNMLVHEYELFVMKKDENISEMSTRSLPKRWEAKMTAISEARDLKVLTLEELFGSLMTYELEMNSKVEEEEVKPKKNFALKSSHHDHDNSEEERDEEEEIALMTRNFKKFLKKKKGFGRRFPKKGENKGESSKTETPTCYKCKKQGHYKNECPQVNKEKMKYKKKALKVTWDDSDESDSDNNSSDNEVGKSLSFGIHK